LVNTTQITPFPKFQRINKPNSSNNPKEPSQENGYLGKPSNPLITLEKPGNFPKSYPSPLATFKKDLNPAL